MLIESTLNRRCFNVVCLLGQMDTVNIELANGNRVLLHAGYKFQQMTF